MTQETIVPKVHLHGVIKNNSFKNTSRYECIVHSKFDSLFILRSTENKKKVNDLDPISSSVCSALNASLNFETFWSFAFLGEETLGFLQRISKNIVWNMDTMR